MTYKFIINLFASNLVQPTVTYASVSQTKTCRMSHMICVPSRHEKSPEMEKFKILYMQDRKNKVKVQF